MLLKKAFFETSFWKLACDGLQLKRSKVQPYFCQVKYWKSWSCNFPYNFGTCCDVPELELRAATCTCSSIVELANKIAPKSAQNQPKSSKSVPGSEHFQALGFSWVISCSLSRGAYLRMTVEKLKKVFLRIGQIRSVGHCYQYWYVIDQHSFLKQKLGV